MNKFVELENQFGAHNYHPLPVVLSKGEGVYAWDVDGKRYLDMMSAYSAVSHGHSHPRLVGVLAEQAQTLAVCSRAYYTDKLGLFLQKLCELTGQDKALPMNTGAEAVETAIKAARKWATLEKGVHDNKAEIIVCENNFHGRTTTIVGFSSEPQYRLGFGPFSPGFKSIPFGDVAALEDAITENTAAFLVEPIQGEGGIIIPPEGYLKQCETLCRERNVLLICDEVQTGMGRTGKFLASDHDHVKPDGLIMGKALGGGLLPVSMFLAREDVMQVFTPGDHGSTFGGSPLAAAVGLEALNILLDENFSETSAVLGEYMLGQLRSLKHSSIEEVRGKGLFIGMELKRSHLTARQFCEKLLTAGLLSKETHDTVVRFAPPLIITKAQIDSALEIIESLL